MSNIQISDGQTVVINGQPVAYFKLLVRDMIGGTNVHLWPSSMTLDDLKEVVRQIEDKLRKDSEKGKGESWTPTMIVTALNDVKTWEDLKKVSCNLSYETTARRMEVWNCLKRVFPEAPTAEDADTVLVILNGLVGRCWTSTVASQSMAGLPALVQRCVDATDDEHYYRRYAHLFAKLKDASFGDFKKTVKNSVATDVLQEAGPTPALKPS